MTVDLEWLVHLGMYIEDFSDAGDTTGKMAGRLSQVLYVSSGAFGRGVRFQLSEGTSYWSISASAAKKIPVIVSSLVFLFEKSFK